MPAELHRCVQHVMSRPDFMPQEGRTPEESAYAICRASMGLAQDGSEDAREVTLQADFNPVTTKEFELARVGRDYRNGPKVFTLTRADLESAVRNFLSFRKLVPVYLLPDHPEIPVRSAGPADGWAEKLWMNGDLLMVRLKLHGRAAQGVMNDEYRGVSMGAFRGPDLQGRPANLILDHVLITNDPFFTDLNANIAASASPGGAEAVIYLTARTEAEMADPKNDKGAPAPGAEDKDLKAKLEAAEKTVIELKAADLRQKEEIETLKGQLANASADVDKEAVAVENVNLKRRCFAQDIRTLVNHGLNVVHNLKAAWCDGYMGKGLLDYEGTITWLKASRFYDATAPNPEDIAFRLLKHKVENDAPLYTVGAKYPSGTPAPGTQGAITLSQEQQDTIRKLGLDPERISALSDKATYEEWLAFKAQREKKAS